MGLEDHHANQITSRSAPAVGARPPDSLGPAAAPSAPSDAQPASELSTVELLKQITAEVGHLASKQVTLAKAELRADLQAELTTIAGLGATAIGAFATFNLLLVTAVLALARVVPGWAAGLLLSAVVAAVSSVVALVSWRRRVRKPLERTRRALREDIEWAKGSVT